MPRTLIETICSAFMKTEGDMPTMADEPNATDKRSSLPEQAKYRRGRFRAGQSGNPSNPYLRGRRNPLRNP
jgi:hypothetical protein